MGHHAQYNVRYGKAWGTTQAGCISESRRSAAFLNVFEDQGLTGRLAAVMPCCFKRLADITRKFVHFEAEKR